jgi:hypothetical protein
MQLKKLNTTLFHVRYNEKYYQDTISSKDFSKLGVLSTPLSFSFSPSSFPCFMPQLFPLYHWTYDWGAKG